MQSCVYFLSYVRNPGPQVFSMYPPADYGENFQRRGGHNFLVYAYGACLMSIGFLCTDEISGGEELKAKFQ
jgi:hypothetical protein